MKNNYSLSGINQPFLDDSILFNSSGIANKEGETSQLSGEIGQQTLLLRRKSTEKKPEERGPYDPLQFSGSSQGAGGTPLSEKVTTQQPGDRQRQTINFSNLLESNVFSVVNETPKTTTIGPQAANSQQTASNNQHLNELAEFLKNARETNKVLLPSEKQNLKSMIQYLNQCLNSFGLSQMGQLHGPDADVQKTVNVVWELIQQKQIDMQFRSNIQQKISKLQSDMSIYREKCEKLKEENAFVLKRLGAAENQSTASDTDFRNRLEKTAAEKDEVAQLLKQAQQKVTQIVHDTRKMQSQKNRVKEQYKAKFPAEKSSTVVRNTVEIVNQFEKNAFVGVWGANELEAAKLMGRAAASRERAFSKMAEENIALRNTLAMLQNELNNLVKNSKEEYVRKRLKTNGGGGGGAADTNDNELHKFFELHFPNIDLIYLKKDIFELPFEKFGCEIVTIFRENFQIVKLFLSKISSLLYSHNYLKELGKEIGEIQVNFHQLKYQVDPKQLIELSSEKWENQKIESKTAVASSLGKLTGHSGKYRQKSMADVVNTDKKQQVKGNYSPNSLKFKVQNSNQGQEGDAKKQEDRQLDDGISDFSESIVSKFSFRELHGGGGLDQDALSENDLMFEIHQQQNQDKTHTVKENMREGQNQLKKWNFVFTKQPD